MSIEDRLYRRNHADGSGCAVLLWGVIFGFMGWVMTGRMDDEHARWATDIRACFIGCMGAGVVWSTAMWHCDILVAHKDYKEKLPVINGFFAVSYVVMVFLTTEAVTGIVRKFGDIEMPCVEYSEDTCEVCLATDDVGGSGGAPNYQCTESGFEPCERCEARKPRFPYSK